MPVQIVAAVIAAAAALIGAAIAAGENAKAQAIREDVAARIGAIKLPILDRLVASKLPPEAAAEWMRSTQAKSTQSDVLGKWMDVVNSKGETADDRAAYLRMSDSANAVATGAASGIRRDMNNRGLEGSGVDFALRQSGAQNAANAANRAGIQEAADARGRYMAALGSAGQLSSQMRSQDQAAKSAVDTINQFNARQQGEADRYNSGLAQQAFDNEMAKNAVEAGARTGVAQGYERSAGAAQSTAAGVGNAALTVGATYDQFGNPIKEKKP